MDEEQRKNEYGFCPKCGALMQNGECSSCGYGKGLHRKGHTEPEHLVIPEQKEERKPKKGMPAGAKAVLIICVSLIVLLFVLIAVAAYTAIRQTVTSVYSDLTEDYFKYYDGSYDYDYDYDYDFDLDDDGGSDSYVPSADDDYYEDFTDATVEGLSYGIEWHQDSYYLDDEDETGYFYSVYPRVIGDDADKLSAVNERIEALVYQYKNGYDEDRDGVSAAGYVTLMEENRLSVVVRYEVEGTESIYRVASATFDMTTGEEIPRGELLKDLDAATAARFRSQNLQQNGKLSFLDELSDEELLDYLSGDDAIVFCTPVGLEVGFNYEKGWVTVTFKDNTL